MGLEVTGAEALAKLAADCRQAGRTDLTRELAEGLREATEPMPAAAQRAALNLLPARNGFAAKVAGSHFTIDVRTTGPDVKVRVVATADLDLPGIDRGRLRHPLFGDREHWYSQPVPRGTFTATWLAFTPRVRASADAALQRVANKLGS